MADFDYSQHSSGNVVAAYTLEARRLRAEMVHAVLNQLATKVRSVSEAARSAFRVPDTEIL